MGLRLLAPLLALILLWYPAPCGAEMLWPDSRLVPAVQSERLRIRMLGRTLASGHGTPGDTAALRVLLERQGFYHAGPGLNLTMASISARPRLAYEPNLNGGLPRAELDLGWIVLQTDPARRARGGLAIGVDLTAQARLSYGRGRHVEISAQLGGLTAPSAGLSAGLGLVSVCANTHLSGWRFLDLCTTQGRTWRALGTVGWREDRLTLSGIVASGWALHDLAGSVGLRKSDAVRQGFAEVTLESAWQRQATAIGLTIAEDVAGTPVEVLRLAAEVRWPRAAGIDRIGLWAGTTNRTVFLGMNRQDTLFGLALGRDFPNGLTTRLSATRRRSSVSFFNSTELSVRFDRSF